jgi:hypothetical protein
MHKLFNLIVRWPGRCVTFYLLLLLAAWAIPTFLTIRPALWSESWEWAKLVIQVGLLVLAVVGGLVPIARWYQDSSQRIVDTKPIVFTEMTDDGKYEIRNVGSAFAANVWYLTDEQDRRALGALAAGGSRVLPFEPAARHVLIAEARPSQRKWTPTINVIQDGVVLHGFLQKLPRKALEHQGTLTTFLATVPDLFQRLSDWSPDNLQ